MININQLLDDLYGEIKNYTEIPQLVLGTEDIPPKLMEYPRMRMAFTIRYNPRPRQTFIKITSMVESDDEDFEDDIEYTYIMNPEATMSINAYGDNVDRYLAKAREWFLIDHYGRRFLENLSENACVIRNITDTQDRKTFLETEYEDRQGFDVILGFSDKVKVIEKTIEEVEINGEKYVKE